MKRMLCQERDTTEAAHREVQVLRAVRHRNVISLIEQVGFDVLSWRYVRSSRGEGRHHSLTVMTVTADYCY